MMKTYSILVTIAVAVCCMTSCSLDEDTTAKSLPENYFRNFSECQVVVNSCYTPLKTIYSGDLFVVAECTTDLANLSGSGNLNAQMDVTPSQPRYGSTAWTNGYLGVQRCNFAIQGIEKAGKEVLSDAQRAQLLCEAKSLRGYYYLFLTQMFNDVPFYTDDIADVETAKRVAALPRMSAVDTRNFVIDDLMEIAPQASQTRTSDNDGQRVGAAFAYMVAAECAMWNKRYDKALEALEAIESIYGDFSQYDLTNSLLFSQKNQPESIFEIQHLYEQGGISYVSNLASYVTPTRKVKDVKDPETGEVTSVTLYDGIPVPYLGTDATTYTAARPNIYFLTSLQTRTGGDARAAINMAWEYGGKEFSSVSSKPWLGPKFWCPNMQSNYDGNNYKVYRYANALLLMAECYCQLKDYSTAVKYLNYTRMRAGIGEYEYRTAARLMDEIQCERGRELFGEFQRKFDLVRWGIWYDRMQETNDYAKLVRQTKPCHEFYPIPDSEVVNSKYILDNKEYEKYGL